MDRRSILSAIGVSIVSLAAGCLDDSTNDSTNGEFGSDYETGTNPDEYVDPINVTLKVVDYQGDSVEDASVSVEKETSPQEDGSEKLQTNENGFVGFLLQSNEVYQIRVTHEDFDPHCTQIYVYDELDVVPIVINNRFGGGEASPDSGDPGYGENSTRGGFGNDTSDEGTSRDGFGDHDYGNEIC